MNIKRTAFQALLHKETGLTEADTDLHGLDLKALVPEGTVAVIVNGEKKTGTGSIDFFPLGDATKIGMRASSLLETHTVALKDRVLYYKLTVPNDTFDISFFGIWVNRFD